MFIYYDAHTTVSSSLSLSGNKSNPALDLCGKASPHHIMMYTVDEIQSHPDVGMSRGGLLLFALLCGGDYHKVSYLWFYCLDTLLMLTSLISGR